MRGGHSPPFELTGQSHLGRVDIYFLHGVRDKIFDYKANCAGNIGNISEQFNAVSGNFIRTPNLLLWGRGVFSRLSAENFLSIAPL